MEIWRETDEAGSIECHKNESEKSWTKKGQTIELILS